MNSRVCLAHGLLSLLLIGSATLTGQPAAAVADIRGVARSGDQPAPDTVIWLDAPHTSRRDRARAVLDQRNLAFSPHVLIVQYLRCGVDTKHVMHTHG